MPSQTSESSLRLDPELRRLYDIVREHRDGLREYDMLRILRGEDALRGLDELELFRVHFLLFHRLYRLKTALEAQGRGSLEIHCLRIRWVPLQGQPANPADLPLAPDPLAEYYLDEDNLANTTRGDVRELLDWFWKRYKVYDRREDALNALGLGPEATATQIRRRYRELVRRHHPDLGGDSDEFCQVVEAMEVLRLLGSR